ncbi:hypothetical protein AB836_01205 [Rickettsiales bacterium (ex Bugula neritina AB1)]|nr:hypothetical protein AB836_01205 [Rickettsiales bacterium (ex Bugula neritina AB1)]
MNFIEIIGRTAVGKSSLFNSLLRQKISIVLSDRVVKTSSIKDTTRDYVRFWGENFVITDNIGTHKNTISDNLKKATYVLYALPWNDIQEYDRNNFRELRRHKINFYLVITKCDMGNYSYKNWEKTGALSVFYVSSKNNVGIKELRNFLGVNNLENKYPIISIIGRINSGKSSLMNLICKKNRSKVSSTPATTRDPVKEIVNDYYFIDTAGFSHINTDVEKISMRKTKTIINLSTICVLVVDLSVGFTHWDKWMISLVEKENKGLLIIFNKEDLINKENHHHDFKYWKIKNYIPYIFFSTLYNKDTKSIFKEINKIFLSINKKISQYQLDKWYENIKKPVINGTSYNISIKIKNNGDYPIFYIYSKTKLNTDYKLYLLNNLVFYFKYYGILPKLIFVKKFFKDK